MVNVGKILKDEREAKGISIYEVSMSLKINAKVLTLIEAGEFTSPALPSKIFIRGFIKSYSQHLKLNVDEMLKAFDSQMAELLPPEKIELNKQQTVQKSDEQTLEQTDFPWKKIIVLSVVLVVLVIVVSIASTVSTQLQSEISNNSADRVGLEAPTTTTLLDTSSLSSTTSTVLSSPSQDSTTTTTTTLVAATTTNPTTTTILAQSSTTTTTTLPAQQSEVVVEALGDVTVSYAFGNLPLSELKLSAGQIHRFKVKTKIRVELSDGSKANVFINGVKREKPQAAGQAFKFEHP